MRKLITIPFMLLMACAGIQPGTGDPTGAVFTNMLPFLGCAMTGKVTVIVNSVDGTVTPKCAPADMLPINCPSGKYEASYNAINGKYDVKCLEVSEPIPGALGGDVLLAPAE